MTRQESNLRTPVPKTGADTSVGLGSVEEPLACPPVAPLGLEPRHFGFRARRLYHSAKAQLLVGVAVGATNPLTRGDGFAAPVAPH